MLKVSVIVPVYRVSQEYLRVCLDSLVAQTMKECEFIVVSDGAPEEVCSVCEEYARKDSRFIFFKREHAGVSATRNFGLSQVQGEYITFVDADDEIECNTCETVYSYAKENDSDIVFWDAKKITKGETLCNSYLNRSEPVLSQIQINDLIKNTIYTTSTKYSSAPLVACKLIRKTLFNSFRIYFPEPVSISEDRVVNISAFAHAKKISYLRAFLYIYRIHNESSSHHYIPDAFYKFTNFIHFLEKDIQENNSESIGNEIIRDFFSSWSMYFFHKDFDASFCNRIKKIKDIAKTDFFKDAVKEANYNNMPVIIRFELFLITHNINAPIYAHGLKALFTNSFHK